MNIPNSFINFEAIEMLTQKLKGAEIKREFHLEILSRRYES